MYGVRRMQGDQAMELFFYGPYLADPVVAGGAPPAVLEADTPRKHQGAG